MQSKKKKKKKMEKWAYLYNLSKIMKLVLFILTIDGTSKQHKMMPQEVFKPGARQPAAGVCLVFYNCFCRQMSACMCVCVCVCVSAPEAINN